MSTPPFLDLPPGAEKVLLPAGHGKLAALVAGSADGGRGTVVLVPGFMGSKEDFIAVLAPISAGGHRVVAIDQRGQFESLGDEDLASYDMSVLADDLLALGSQLGGPIHLVGHSFGGLVARAAALADPAALRSLTLLSSGPAAIPPPAANNLQLIVQALPAMGLESIWAAKRELEAQMEQMEGQTAVEPPTPEIEDFLHRRFVAGSPTAILRQAQQLLAEPDRVDDLAAVDLPVLVAYGSDDDAWPPRQQAEMARRLGATPVVIEAGGHSPCAQRPDETARVLLGFFASC